MLIPFTKTSVYLCTPGLTPDMSQPDDFNDILTSATGVFGLDTPGLAPASHDSVKVRVVEAGALGQDYPSGVVMQCMCNACGTNNVILLEWPEVIALKYQVGPQVAFQPGQQLFQRHHPGQPPPQPIAANRFLSGSATTWEWNPSANHWALRQECVKTGCDWSQPITIAGSETHRWLAEGKRRQLVVNEVPISHHCSAMNKQRGQRRG